MRLGILGGTFDPIHYGHLFIAEEARVLYGLQQVLFIPNGTPPHKLGLGVTPAEHRAAMVTLAITPNPNFVFSPLEIKRSGISYTIDTLKSLQAENPNAELFYIAGLDTVFDLKNWRSPEQVMQSCKILVAARPGYDASEISLHVPSEYCNRFHLLPTPELGVRATDIRQRVREGRTIRYLTPDPVIQYIEEARLYR